MSTPRPVAKYHCTQAELYAICSIGWQSYLENQADFLAFSTRYTIPFGQDALTNMEAAKALPDFQARNQSTETAYILMGQHAESGLGKWRALRSYIKASFPTELQKPNIEAAGELHYNKAMTRNWSETELMFTSALAYIATNTVELTAGGMPATFETDFSDISTLYDRQYATFTDSGQDEHEGTDQKVIANNGCYDSLQRMFEDGQIVYEKNASKRDRFIFAKVKGLITTAPTSGTGPVPPNVLEISGIITSTNTGLPLAGATIQVTIPTGIPPFTTLSEANGIYKLDIENLVDPNPFNIDILVTATDHDPDQSSVEVSAGNAYHLDFSLPLT